MNTFEKFAAIENSGLQIAYDGCHKIYILESDSDRSEAVEAGYEIHPADEVYDLYQESCGLEFVHPWSLVDNHPWDIEQFS